MKTEELIELLREARETLHDFAENFDCDVVWHKYDTNCRACDAAKQRNRIDAALAEWEVKERVATVTIGNGNGSACTTCNVTGVDTGVVIDTLPPMYMVKCPACGNTWSYYDQR